eukprot:TCALIF_06113-PA protein Name:"Protein of unknown function" AED:0.18 eAED:0.42 QI:0/0.5/0.4/0.8/0.75/0.6/5/115/203
MKAAISTLVFVLAINGGSAWPYVEGFSSVDTKSSSCHFLDASPFFRTHPSTQTDVRSSEELDEIVLLTEFSRFMNAKAMDLLQEFAEIKKLYEVKKQFQHFHDTPAMTRRSDVRGARDLKVIDPKPEPVPTTFFKTALAQEDMMRGDRIISHPHPDLEQRVLLGVVPLSQGQVQSIAMHGLHSVDYDCGCRVQEGFSRYEIHS